MNTLQDLQKWYNSNKDEVDKIKNTPGFKVFIDFWVTELQAIDAKLETEMDRDKVYDIVLHRKPIIKYLRFIKNITSTSPPNS